MPVFLPFVLLAAALACLFIGRILLAVAAFGVSTLWGFTVLFVPFGPLLFRMSYRELAYPTRYWRLATMPLFLLTILSGGSKIITESRKNLSFQSLKDQLAKPTTVVASAGDTSFRIPVLTPAATPAPKSTPAPALASAPMTLTLPTTLTVPASATVPVKAAAPANTVVQTNAPAPAATPSKGVAAAMAAMPAAPKVLSLPERMEANRKEFERLAEWYTNLKNERGYLLKGDSAAVIAYNAEAARYQTALQLAKTEQADIAKLAAKQ